MCTLAVYVVETESVQHAFSTATRNSFIRAQIVPILNYIKLLELANIDFSQKYNPSNWDRFLWGTRYM